MEYPASTNIYLEHTAVDSVINDSCVITHLHRGMISPTLLGYLHLGHRDYSLP